MECALCRAKVAWRDHWWKFHPDMYVCVPCAKEGREYFVADEDYTGHLATMHSGIKVVVLRPNQDGHTQEF
jgi:hypothetical protein